MVLLELSNGQVTITLQTISLSTNVATTSTVQSGSTFTHFDYNDDLELESEDRIDSDPVGCAAATAVLAAHSASWHCSAGRRVTLLILGTQTQAPGTATR